MTHAPTLWWTLSICRAILASPEINLEQSSHLSFVGGRGIWKNNYANFDRLSILHSTRHTTPHYSLNNTLLSQKEWTVKHIEADAKPTLVCGEIMLCLANMCFVRNLWRTCLLHTGHETFWLALDFLPEWLYSRWLLNSFSLRNHETTRNYYTANHCLGRTQLLCFTLIFS